MARNYNFIPPLPGGSTNTNDDPDDDELDEDGINTAAANQAADTIIGDEDAADYDYEDVPTVLPGEGGPPSDDQIVQEVPVNAGPDSAGSDEDELYDPSTANLKQGGNIEADLISNTGDDEQDLDAIGTLDDSGAGTDVEMPIDDEDAAVTVEEEPEEWEDLSTFQPDATLGGGLTDDIVETVVGGGNIGNETEEDKTFQELLEENLMAKMMEDAQSAGQRDAGRAIAAARAQAGRGQMGMSGGILAAQSDAVSNAVANAEDRLFGQQMQAGRLGAGIETEERNLLLNAIAVREDLGLDDDEFRSLLEGIGLDPDALPDLGGGDDEPDEVEEEEESVLTYDELFSAAQNPVNDNAYMLEEDIMVINTESAGMSIPSEFVLDEGNIMRVDDWDHYVYIDPDSNTAILVRVDRAGQPANQ
jgi:hypothetical protein